MNVSEFGDDETKESIEDDKIIRNSVIGRFIYAYEKTRVFHSFIMIFVFCFIPFSLLALTNPPLHSPSELSMLPPYIISQIKRHDVCENPFKSYIDYYIFERDNYSSCISLEEAENKSSKSPNQEFRLSWRRLKACVKTALKKSTNFVLYMVAPAFSIYQFLQLLINVAEILKEL